MANGPTHKPSMAEIVPLRPAGGDALPRPTRQSRPLHALGRIITAGLDTLLAWQDRDRQRRHLAGLDERALKDVGLTPAEVWAETRKAVWHK